MNSTGSLDSTSMNSTQWSSSPQRTNSTLCTDSDYDGTRCNFMSGSSGSESVRNEFPFS